MRPYHSASKKQVAYIGILCERLGITDPTLYSRYSSVQAARLIKSYKRRIEMKQKHESENNQLGLF